LVRGGVLRIVSLCFGLFRASHARFAAKPQAHKRIDGAKRLHVLLEHSVAAKAGGEFLMKDCRKLGPQAARRGIWLTAAK
jgi:hypothetical protein